MITIDPNNSAPHEPSGPELSLGESPLPEQRSVRRRLVQATLFPLKPKQQDRQVNGDLKCEKDCYEILDGKDEEYCESQNKPKKKTRRNSTPPEKASGKVNKQITWVVFFLFCRIENLEF